ncbi:hypothetical protein SpCBS45565_g08346 [Spizellomyces sp. 'palustris']|nr:hypothetical protein SpCBS45565_g08346 [Spizellomyces sp. 'palustris']
MQTAVTADKRAIPLDETTQAYVENLARNTVTVNFGQSKLDISTKSTPGIMPTSMSASCVQHRSGVACIGGMNANYEYLPTVLTVFNPDNPSDRTSTAFPSIAPRWNMGSALLGDKLYIFGGQAPTTANVDLNAYQDLYVINLVSKTLESSTIGAPQRRSHMCMAEITLTSFLLFGGYAGAYNDETWIYDVSTGWKDITAEVKAKGAYPAARQGSRCVNVQGSIYMFAGKTSATTATNDVWRFDPASHSWEQLSPYFAVPATTQPSARGYASMLAVGNILAIVGGRDLTDSAQDPYMYFFNVQERKWVDDTAALAAFPKGTSPPDNSTEDPQKPPVVTPEKKNTAVIAGAAGGGAAVVLAAGALIFYGKRRRRHPKPSGNVTHCVLQTGQTNKHNDGRPPSAHPSEVATLYSPSPHEELMIPGGYQPVPLGHQPSQNTMSFESATRSSAYQPGSWDNSGISPRSSSVSEGHPVTPSSPLPSLYPGHTSFDSSSASEVRPISPPVPQSTPLDRGYTQSSPPPYATLGDRDLSHPTVMRLRTIIPAMPAMPAKPVMPAMQEYCAPAMTVTKMGVEMGESAGPMEVIQKAEIQVEDSNNEGLPHMGKIRFTPRSKANTDEMEVSPGDVIYVKELFKDGWAQGWNATKNVAGFFPYNCVERRE